MATLQRLEPRNLLVVALWNGSASDDWGNAANWVDNQVPGANDTARFLTNGGLALLYDNHLVTELYVEGDTDLDLHGYNLSVPNETIVKYPSTTWTVFNSQATLGTLDSHQVGVAGTLLVDGSNVKLVTTELDIYGSGELKDGAKGDIGTLWVEGDLDDPASFSTSGTAPSLPQTFLYVKDVRVADYATATFGQVSATVNVTVSMQLNGVESAIDIYDKVLVESDDLVPAVPRPLDVFKGILTVHDTGRLESGEATIDAGGEIRVEAGKWRGNEAVSVNGGRITLTNSAEANLGELLLKTDQNNNLAVMTIESGSMLLRQEPLTINTGGNQFIVSGGSTVTRSDIWVGGNAVGDTRSLLRVSGANSIVTAKNSEFSVADTVEILAGGSVIADEITNGGTIRGSDGKAIVEQEFKNGGKILIGNSPGELEIDGEFVQESSGSIEIEIGGTTPSDEYDVLNITDTESESGVANLGGTLEVKLYNEYEPSLEEYYDVIHAVAINGSFEHVDFSAAPLPEGLGWQVEYLDLEGESVVRLTVIEVESDIAITGFTPVSDGKRVAIDYTITSDDDAIPAFSIALGTSADGTAYGSNLFMFRVDDPADLEVGSHTIYVSPDFTDTLSDYYLMAKVDSAEELSETDEGNNVALFSGGLFLSGTTLHIQGTDSADTATVSQSGGGFSVTYGGVSRSYDLTDIDSIAARLHGSADSLTGTSVDRVMRFWGGAGNDTGYGGSGNDTFWGGAGADTFFGYGGADQLNGEADDDYLWGGAGNDYLSGGGGADHAYGQENDDTVDGGADGDCLEGNDGNDTLYGQAGNDSAYGGDGNDTLFGGDDADWLWGGYGADSIEGGLGNDYIVGDDWSENTSLDGADTLHGNDGNDTIYAGYGGDSLFGDEGDDLRSHLVTRLDGVRHDLQARATICVAA